MADRDRPHTARDALIAIGLVVLLLGLAEGRAVRHAGETMKPGWERELVLAVGRPAGWLADRIRPSGGEGAGGGPGGFAQSPAPGGRAAGAVTPEAFPAGTLGDRPPAPRPLRAVLVTGDSMAQPLDADLARRLAGAGVRTVRDAHVGTGISDTTLVDWGRLSTSQARRDRPDAVVMFIGANEGFPMRIGGRQVACCAAPWAAEYASRARRMMATYRRNGATRVYWLLLPQPRDRARQVIARAVNAAVVAAAQPYRRDVAILDLPRIFTPGGRYRDAMAVGGRETIVRESDGIHLNGAGSQLAADRVLANLRRAFVIR